MISIFASVAQNMPAKLVFVVLVSVGAIGWDIVLRRRTVAGAAVLASITIGMPYAFLSYVIFDLSVVGGSFLMVLSPILALPIAIAAIITSRWARRLRHQKASR